MQRARTTFVTRPRFRVGWGAARLLFVPLNLHVKNLYNKQCIGIHHHYRSTSAQLTIAKYSAASDIVTEYTFDVCMEALKFL